MAPRERPWLSPGRPPWAEPEPAPPWWEGLGVRVALVAALVLLDPHRAARAYGAPMIGTPTTRERLRAGVAWCCSRVYTACRRLGLIE